MGRIRYIKPEFFLDEDLADLSIAARLCFIGLWTIADKEGRLECRPLRIRAQVFPYDPEIDVDGLLDELARARGRFIVRYKVAGKEYLQIRSFAKHQRPHPKEQPSVLPPPPDGADSADEHVLDLQPDPSTASREISRQVAEGLASDSPHENPSATCRLGMGMGTGMGNGDGARGMGPRARDPVPPAPAPARAVPEPWASGWEWRQAFGAAWEAVYGAFYGNTSDSRAIRDLEDLLRGFPPEQAAALWEHRAAMFTAFLADRADALVKARHAFAFFVPRFGDYRPDVRTLASVAGKAPPADCDFHRHGRNSGRRAPKHEWRAGCPECRHLGARDHPRPPASPTAIGDLGSELTPGR